MNKTLRWKKTISILAIISAGTFFISGFFICSTINQELSSLVGVSNTVVSNDYRNLLSFIKTMIIISMFILLSISILGIILLCIEQNSTKGTPKSRKICFTILITVGSLLFLGIITYFYALFIIQRNTINSISNVILYVILFCGVIFIFSPFIVLIIFCSLGLYGKQRNKPTIIEPTPLDEEIAKLKKQIEKRKLEKEVAQLNTEKQAEIEKLKKELTELE